MSELYILKFVMRNNTEQTVSKVVKLRFYKDRYLPGTELSGKVIWTGSTEDVVGIKLTAGGRLIHDGFPEYITAARANGRQEISFKSAGWSKLLAQNEPVPGLSYNVSLTTIMTDNTAIPNVTWEDNTPTVNYIYVKEHSSVWDAVTAYTKKAFGPFPYILGTNKVMTRPVQGTLREYYSDVIKAVGETVDRRTVYSKVYMADADGRYTYQVQNMRAISDGLVREKYFPLDRQWLADPSDGARYRMDLSARRYYSPFLRVVGYSGEELFDRFLGVIGNESISGMIGGLEVVFENGRAVTTVYILN